MLHVFVVVLYGVVYLVLVRQFGFLLLIVVFYCVCDLNDKTNSIRHIKLNHNHQYITKLELYIL